MADTGATPRSPYRGHALACVLSLACMGCGAKERTRLEQQVKVLQGDLERSQQYVADLKVHISTVRARNKVLIGLVKGLTADPGTGGDVGAAHEALETLDEDIQLLAHTLRKSRQEMVALRTQRQQLETNLTEAMRTIEDAKRREAQAQARLQTFRDMLLRLKSLIETEELELQIVRNQMVVQLPEAVLFESGKADIIDAGKPLLDHVGAALTQVQDREFQVAGHTDNVPIRTWRFRSNWHLSGARAITVTNYLVERGVPRDRISAAAYGDTRPLQSNDTEAGRSANRRIEIVLLPNLDELPDLTTLGAELHRDGAAEGEGTQGGDATPDAPAPEPETAPTNEPAATTKPPAAAAAAQTAAGNAPATETETKPEPAVDQP